jgi:Zn-dependent protease with chaperone function
MADTALPYPPTPPNVPPDLTTPTTSYRVRVVVVLLSLFLFVFIYVGLVIGSAYLCYTSFAALGRPTSANPLAANVLQETARTDERLTKAYNRLVEQSRTGNISETHFVETLERDLLPPWRAQRQRLMQLRGLAAEEQRLVNRYNECLALQEESWELLARAVRNHDAEVADQSRQKAMKSEQLTRQLVADGERYARVHSQPKDDSGVGNILVGIVSGLLCLFLIKGFFKWRRADRSQRLEVTEKDQPILFAFIRQLCRDVGAPLPHRVFLTPDVNAAVFYHEALLNLVLPTPKNLLIGLGLVNQLNLSEFKAVLAHEFGHFSQNSMKLGSYVYMSNRIISDVLFGRDWLDDLVAVLRGIDIRIAIFAWGFTGIMWGLRKTLQGLFRVINFAHSSLSRLMEFNADLVAVRVTGSDALVHGLARLDFASESLGQAWSDLSAAADQQLYSRDLFYHHTRAAEYLRAIRKDPRLGQPPALPDDPVQVVQVFQPEDTSVPKMWATHPSNRDREVNAKRRYVRSHIDERSPWVLFQDADAVRAEATRRVYQNARKPSDVQLQDPEIVQAFIDEEHAETTYHPRYHGFYDNRYLRAGELDELVRSADVPSADRLSEAHAQLFGEELKARMEAHRARHEDYRRVAPLAHGAVQLTGKNFQFRGARYAAADARGLLEQVQKELDQDYDWMAGVDREVFLVHYGMARQLGEEAQREMNDRYRFHIAVQAIHGELSAHQQHVQATLNQISGKRELSREEFYLAVNALEQAHDALTRVLAVAEDQHLPALKNVTPGAPLAPMLLSQPPIRRISSASNSLEGEWIGRFMEQLAEVIDRAQRIHFKSLGGILALHERLAEQWAARADPVGRIS